MSFLDFGLLLFSLLTISMNEIFSEFSNAFHFSLLDMLILVDLPLLAI